ncbi:hypothetical protein [Kaistella polysaccharea]|uniref:hypothetical protein n=1 Tax=Kaistella polysaccharea TaxID=2878534 RepID=UPI001CF2C6E5|nr:hypothetical protein [Kaistella polysaccharea]
MKKLLLTATSCALLVVASCTKNTEGNTNIVKNEDGSDIQLPIDSSAREKIMSNDSTNAKEYTDRYVAEDGTSALVTFKNGDADKTISIRSNNKTITAPQKEAWAKGGVYGNFDIEIVAKNDSVTITQGNNVIRLKKAKGE